MSLSRSIILRPLAIFSSRHRNSSSLSSIVVADSPSTNGRTSVIESFLSSHVIIPCGVHERRRAWRVQPSYAAGQYHAPRNVVGLCQTAAELTSTNFLLRQLTVDAEVRVAVRRYASLRNGDAKRCQVQADDDDDDDEFAACQHWSKEPRRKPVKLRPTEIIVARIRFSPRTEEMSSVKIIENPEVPGELSVGSETDPFSLSIRSVASQ